MSESRKLVRHVTVAGTTYGPGDVVPDDIAAQITNPKVWAPAAGGGAAEHDDERGPAGTRSGGKLAQSVTVGGTTYGPKDFIPDDVAAKIKNPKAWVGGKAPALAGADEPKTDPGGEGSKVEGEGLKAIDPPKAADVKVGESKKGAPAKDASGEAPKADPPTTARRP